jgi:hypothetical protein
MVLRYDMPVKEAIMCMPHAAEVDGQLEIKRGTRGAGYDSSPSLQGTVLKLSR